MLYLYGGPGGSLLRTYSHFLCVLRAFFCVLRSFFCVLRAFSCVLRAFSCVLYARFPVCYAHFAVCYAHFAVCYAHFAVCYANFAVCYARFSSSTRSTKIIVARSTEPSRTNATGPGGSKDTALSNLVRNITDLRNRLVVT